MIPLIRDLWFFAHGICPISSALSSHNPSLWSAEFPSSLQPFPRILFGTEGVPEPTAFSPNCLCRQVLYQIVAFSPFSLFPLLGLWFKAGIRVCSGRTAGDAHCVPDLTHAALCRAAPVPEHLEFIKFIYRAQFALSASADAVTSCPKSSSRIKCIFPFWGQWGFASGCKFLILGGSSDGQMFLALIMKDSKQRMGTEEILELSSQKIHMDSECWNKDYVADDLSQLKYECTAT